MLVVRRQKNNHKVAVMIDTLSAVDKAGQKSFDALHELSRSARGEMGATLYLQIQDRGYERGCFERGICVL